MHRRTATLREATNISMIMDFPQPTPPQTYIPFGVTLRTLKTKNFRFFQLKHVTHQIWLRALPAPSLLDFTQAHIFCMYQQVTPLFGFTRSSNYRKGQFIN